MCSYFRRLKHCAEYRRRNIKIFSDSLSVLLSMQNGKMDIKVNPYILEIKRKYVEFLDKSSNRYNIMFYWIPSHRGLLGNELADALARGAAKSKSDSTDYNVPFTDFKEGFKTIMYKSTEDYIIKLSLNKGKDYFKNYYKKVLNLVFLIKIYPGNI